MVSAVPVMNDQSALVRGADRGDLDLCATSQNGTESALARLRVTANKNGL